MVGEKIKQTGVRLVGGVSFIPVTGSRHLGQPESLRKFELARKSNFSSFILVEDILSFSPLDFPSVLPSPS